MRKFCEYVEEHAVDTAIDDEESRKENEKSMAKRYVQLLVTRMIKMVSTWKTRRIVQAGVDQPRAVSTA